MDGNQEKIKSGSMFRSSQEADERHYDQALRSIAFFTLIPSKMDNLTLSKLNIFFETNIKSSWLLEKQMKKSKNILKSKVTWLHPLFSGTVVLAAKCTFSFYSYNN